MPSGTCKVYKKTLFVNTLLTGKGEPEVLDTDNFPSAIRHQRQEVEQSIISSTNLSNEQFCETEEQE